MSGIYQKIAPDHAGNALKAVAVISSAFVVWRKRDGERSGRFVVHFSVQYTSWNKGTVRMDNLTEFLMSVHPEDHMISFYIEKGVPHLGIHPTIRDWIIFHYDGQYYQFVSVPFGWGHSPLRFTRLVSPFVAELWYYGYRMLHYMDEFIAIPSPYDVKSGPAKLPELQDALKAWSSTPSEKGGM